MRCCWLSILTCRTSLEPKCSILAAAVRQARQLYLHRSPSHRAEDLPRIRGAAYRQRRPAGEQAGGRLRGCRRWCGVALTRPEAREKAQAAPGWPRHGRWAALLRMAITCPWRQTWQCLRPTAIGPVAENWVVCSTTPVTTYKNIKGMADQNQWHDEEKYLDNDLGAKH